MNDEYWKSVDSFLRASDISGASSYLENLIDAENTEFFASLPELRFTNSQSDVLSHISDFIESCTSEFDVRAVYLEMNGFDANNTLWYFDSFAYSNYSDDPDDLEWLCDWQSPSWPEFELTGLEPIQQDFGLYLFNKIYKDKSYENVYTATMLLVMVRFVELIQSALATGSLFKPVPILATAHDFDIVGRFPA